MAKMYTTHTPTLLPNLLAASAGGALEAGGGLFDCHIIYVAVTSNAITFV